MLLSYAKFPFISILKITLKRSGDDFIFASFILLRPNTTQNCSKTYCYVIFNPEMFKKMFKE